MLAMLIGLAAALPTSPASAIDPKQAAQRCKKNPNCKDMGTDSAGIQQWVTCDPKGTPNGKCRTTTCHGKRCVQTLVHPVQGAVGGVARPPAAGTFDSRGR